MAAPGTALAPAWVARHRRRAARDGAYKVQFTERTPQGATLTVTSWLRRGRADRAPRPSKTTAAATSKRGSSESRASPAPSRPVQTSAAAAAAAGDAPRATRNARQRRSAERSAQHHRRMRWRRLWRLCTRAVLAAVRLLRLGRSRALRMMPPPPSKRARDEGEDTGGQLLQLLPGPSSPAGAAVDVDAALQVDAAEAPATKRPGGLRAGFLIAGSRIFRSQATPRVSGYTPPD